MTRKHFDDLTKIDCALGELNDDTHDRLRAAHKVGQTVQVQDQSPDIWLDIRDPLWHVYLVYRLRPTPLTKPSINPDHVVPWVKWIARDEDEKVFGFERKPDIRIDVWAADGGRYCDLHAVASLDPGTCHWRDSLVELRPQEGEE